MGNLIEEQSEIINRIDNEGESGTVPVMIIGNNNVFEVDKYFSFIFKENF